MPSQNTVINSIESGKETILGMTLAIEQRFGCEPRNDISTTLNTKFNVFPSNLPTADKLVQYFCWGVGGRKNDTDSLTSAQPVLGTNMALYAMRPFRARPLTNDLSSVERANYAMRSIQVIGGVTCALYYLKKIDFSASQVQYTITDPSTGIVTDYNLNPGNLSPTPPTPSSNGVITDVADQISVVLPGTAIITGEEVFESMTVVDGGDTRYANISEMGFVSAAKQTVSAVNSSGQPFSYEEAIMAQLVNQFNWAGTSLLSNNDTFTRNLVFSCRNLILP